MKKIEIRLQDPVIRMLVREQIAAAGDIDETLANPDIIIASEASDLPVPHLLIGARGHDGQTLSLPLRLGEMMDRLRYLLSGRDRFAQADKIIFGPFILGLDDGMLSTAESVEPVRLTDKEKLIIQSLHEAPGRSLDRAALLSRVWGYAETAETHTLETHLYRLRQKLEESFGVRDVIVTKDGFYTLNAE